MKKLFTVLFLLNFVIAFSQESINMQDSIDKYRKGLIIIKTTPNIEIELEQVRHEFRFGAALANQAFDGTFSEEDVNTYKQKFLDNFNSAVTENALKWGVMEPEKGLVDFSTTDKILNWTEENGITLRGHNIYWGIPRFVQDWVKNLEADKLYKELHKRAYTIAGRYKGRFIEYDLNNEMIHANYYEEKLGKGITNKMAKWVKEMDPTARLFLNDYDILTGKMLERYVNHIQELLENNVSIDGIGVQGHLHAEDFNRDTLRHALDVLAQFDLPIVITEFNMPGQRSKFYQDRNTEMTVANEELKARNLEDYYRICFAHPAVDGILMWGFWEGANWIPASSLFKKDWTPTPALDAYRSLVFDEWWTTYRGKSDEEGYCLISVFYGTHKIKIGGKEKVVELRPEDSSLVVNF